MSDHRHRFLQLALTADALRFGQFTLKSGRLSPYFFNAGRFDSACAWSSWPPATPMRWKPPG